MSDLPRTDQPRTGGIGNDGTGNDPPPPGKRALPPGPAIAALILLAIPIVVLVLVPIYARDEPELLGFPFFYWFQLVMVVVASALTYTAYVIVQRARRGPGGPR